LAHVVGDVRGGPARVAEGRVLRSGWIGAHEDLPSFVDARLGAGLQVLVLASFRDVGGTEARQEEHGQGREDPYFPRTSGSHRRSVAIKPTNILPIDSMVPRIHVESPCWALVIPDRAVVPNGKWPELLSEEKLPAMASIPFRI
jgi:hypothetical protein